MQLAAVTTDGGQIGRELEHDADPGGAHLVFQQQDGFAGNAVQVDAHQVDGAHARKVQQAVDDFGGAEGLLCDLVEHRA